MRKTDVLKDNLDKSIFRSQDSFYKENRKEMPDVQKKREKKQFLKAAVESEKRLARVWNQDESEETDTSARPELGYFGGLDFNKEGEIIR